VQGTEDPPLFNRILKVFGNEVEWQRLTLSHRLRSLGPILGIRVPRWNIFVLFDVAPWWSVPRPRIARRVFNLVGLSGVRSIIISFSWLTLPWKRLHILNVHIIWIGNSGKWIMWLTFAEDEVCRYEIKVIRRYRVKLSISPPSIRIGEEFTSLSLPKLGWPCWRCCKSVSVGGLLFENDGLYLVKMPVLMA
jgi:hypothetical protein